MKLIEVMRKVLKEPKRLTQIYEEVKEIADEGGQ
jgi:hypothetical protein